jgi:hypothetical protein
MALRSIPSVQAFQVTTGMKKHIEPKALSIPVPLKQGRKILPETPINKLCSKK